MTNIQTTIGTCNARNAPSAPSLTHQARARTSPRQGLKDPQPRDATTSDAAADRRIAPRSTGNGRSQGGQGKVGFQAWAAHLEGAEAGGDSVHGRRFLWPSGSMESSPAAPRRQGWSNQEGDGDRP